MSVLLLTSAGHAPGVTALGVALAVTWPEPVLFVDANREPDQTVLAGHLQGSDPGGRGLGGLLQAHRERRPLAACLDAMTVPLADGGRDFLPGFSHPGMVALFGPAWTELARALEDAGRTVLVDAGRITPDGLPPALVAASSGVAVVTGSRLVDLAALRLYLPLVVAAAGEERVGLVVVGPGRPYGSGEIGHRFGVPVWGKVAWQPVEAGVFASGEPAPRRLLSSAYVADVRALGAVLAARATDRRALLREPGRSSVPHHATGRGSPAS
ncbi:MAG: hypothetical protein QM779_13745 [Propionicimonas sp.]|uniref:hypothetical protein n=1 Tax=Propionicimonas sp. TaxID=1955623 RepID=UPI003D13A7FA